jgi:uracil-DNA glycosylase
MADSLRAVTDEIVVCTLCPRLVAWRESVAVDPPVRYRGQSYWARPVPGFGDRSASLLVFGLAPAAHGGNRTGRVFTGDRSGDWLFRALHRAGYANQPTSVSADDGLKLTGAYVLAMVRCAPPDNKPTTTERDTCFGYALREIRLLKKVRSVLALGSFGWDGALRAMAALGHELPRPRPRFGHTASASIGPYTLVGSYHPSQQNTFTGKLTEQMFDDAIALAAR